MRGKIILAEHATVSGGNTINMLNAFINRVQGKGPKYAFRTMVAVQIVGDMVDAGEHQFDVLSMNEDGADIMPKIAGTFEVPRGGGVSHLIIGLGLVFERPGRYMFALRVDNVELDHAIVTVVQQPGIRNIYGENLSQTFQIALFTRPKAAEGAGWLVAPQPVSRSSIRSYRSSRDAARRFQLPMTSSPRRCGRGGLLLHALEAVLAVVALVVPDRSFRGLDRDPCPTAPGTPHDVVDHRPARVGLRLLRRRQPRLAAVLAPPAVRLLAPPDPPAHHERVLAPAFRALRAHHPLQRHRRRLCVL